MFGFILLIILIVLLYIFGIEKDGSYNTNAYILLGIFIGSFVTSVIDKTYTMEMGRGKMYKNRYGKNRGRVNLPPSVVETIISGSADPHGGNINSGNGKLIIHENREGNIPVVPI